MTKKRMKGYFQYLPGKNAAYTNRAGKDLKDYVPFDNIYKEENVNAPDIRHVLSELLPIIAREAYFTSALFGLSRKETDGHNFERYRDAVDNSSRHFRHCIERTCGIVPFDSRGKSISEMGVKGNPMLCSVASIYLNEAMDSYIDREKKGGDDSLSLAYVRATILDLRKEADRQWVIWVDKQIEWIRSNDSVPLSEKKLESFLALPDFPATSTTYSNVVEMVATPRIRLPLSTLRRSTDAYLGWTIKREFAALHELFSRVSKARKDFGDKEVATHVPKIFFVNTLNLKANCMVMNEKIGLMYSSMEKHLCEEGGFFPVAWKALTKVRFLLFRLWEKLSLKIYLHKLDPGAVDIVRICVKAAGGAAKLKTEEKDHELILASRLD